MAGFWSDSGSGSGSDYSLDLTASDEELLWAIVDRLPAVSPQSRPAPATPATPARPTNTSTPVRSSPFSPDLDPDDTLAIQEALAAITDDDLSFDISELQEDDAFPHGQGAAHLYDGPSRNSTPERQNRRPSPPVSGDNDHVASFLTRTNPRSMHALLPGPDVDYPDLSGALSDAQQTARQWGETEEEAKESVEVGRSPLLRFRTYPKKPLSVSDLTAGSWCELQHFYTLTRLRGKKTRTEAMKRGTKLHQKLEREIYTTKQITTIKKEDPFGLKIWNMIQGLRVLREEGFTREFEVWGMVDGNLVCGVIDELGYKNPDQELEEDVLSSRGSSQNITNSQPYEASMPGDTQVFVTDVKTRNTSNPPPQSQVRVAIIQLFLYHRFMSDMAAGRLDYMAVFERYGLKPDETFSDSFMAQIGEMHKEIFADADTESTSTFDDDGSSTTEAGEFVSAPSSPSQLSFASSNPEPTLKYRTLRTLVSLLKFELHLTFPRGASDLGNIVAVEYRYRGRDTPRPPPPNPNPDSAAAGVANPTLPTNLALNPDETDPFQPNSRPPRKQEPEPGSVICTNTFFVEPETLDLFLSETMAWWKGEREPQGVPVEEAGFKCRSCEFLEDCGWRQSMDLEARKRARGRGGGSVAGSTAGVSVGVGDVEDAGGAAPKRRGRPRKVEKEEAEVDVDAEREIEMAEREAKREAKRGRGRPKKAEQVVDVEVGEVETERGGKGKAKNIILREGPRW